jgi:hypothetical protein
MVCLRQLILVRPTGTRSPGLEIGYKLTEGALALLHPDELVFSVGLGTDWLEFQFEHCEEGIPVCKRRLAFCKRFYVGLGPHSCILDHEKEGRGGHFVNVKQGGSVCTLHFLSLGIAERKAIFVCVDPNAEGAPKQSG